MKFTYISFILLFLCNCNTSHSEDSSHENDDVKESAEETLYIEFMKGKIVQAYNPELYDTQRTIRGTFSFKTNYPKGTKAVVSTFHPVETARNEPEFAPSHDTIELTSTFSYKVLGPHAFGTISMGIPLEMQTDVIRKALKGYKRQQTVFFRVTNQNKAKDIIEVEMERTITNKD